MANQTALRAAVIGLGRMGMHHVRACMDAKSTNLIAVYDSQAQLTKNVAEETGSTAVRALPDLLDQIDIAIIAAPTLRHLDTALPLLESGISCLVEKPIAASEDDAVAMINAAASSGAHLHVGHVERFNPAITSLRKALDADIKAGAKISGLSAKRLNLKMDRQYDADAVLDLMIHDLDLLNTLKLGEISEVKVELNCTEHNVAAELVLEMGATALFDVSRVADQQDRQLVIETDLASLHADFTGKTVVRSTGGSKTALPVEATDALRAQLQSFVEACKDETTVVATGEEALTALRLANRIRASAGLL